jgi:hypothetical protein
VRLVGGTGLALLLGHRVSDDLDLFCGPREDVEPVVRAVEEAARAEVGEPTRVRSAPGFARIEVPHAQQTLRFDVAADTAPRLVPEDTYVGAIRVESLRDQRANKLVALLGRSELRDLVDLYFIEKAGLHVIDGLEDATKKDGGMDPAWFAWALEQIAIEPLPGMIASLDPNELAAFRADLARAALDRAGAAIGKP